MTIDRLGPEMIGLDLAEFVPARTFDKYVYSPWTGSDLHQHQQLRSDGIDAIVITGDDTRVCVLSTAPGGDRPRLSRHPHYRCAAAPRTKRTTR